MAKADRMSWRSAIAIRSVALFGVLLGAMLFGVAARAQTAGPSRSSQSSSGPSSGPSSGGRGAEGGQIVRSGPEVEYVDEEEGLRPRGGRNRDRRPRSAVVRPEIFLPPPGERRFVEGEVLVEVATGVKIATVAARHRLEILGSEPFVLAGATVHRLRGRAGLSTRRLLAELAGDRAIRWAQPNHDYVLQQDGASPRPSASVAGAQELPGQWASEKLDLAEAHRLSHGADVTIGVIDTSVDTTHPDLVGVVVESFDALGIADGRPPQHGTAMAGATAARGRLVGAAPASRLVVARAFAEGLGTGGGQGTSWHVTKGLDWVVGHGARIVGMSFAGPRDPLLSRSIAAALERGVIAVAAAGNAGDRSPPLYPAADPGVLAVTAVDGDDRIFAGAVRGVHVVVAAPGVDVLVAAPEGRYDLSTGTSVAAAEVVGVVALLLEKKPELGEAEIRRILQKSARDLGARGIDPVFGAGAVDAHRALEVADAPRGGASR